MVPKPGGISCTTPLAEAAASVYMDSTRFEGEDRGWCVDEQAAQGVAALADPQQPLLTPAGVLA